ncbi:MAG: proliferating cell nuclear antigen (pcna) [Candidatus Helarchaeota archaeon]
MFKASLSSAGSFIKIIDALATIIDTGTFKVSQDGLSLKAMDPSHVAMVNLEMPSTAFTEFQCDETLPIRVNLIDLNRFVKRGSASDELELSLDEQRNKLKIRFKKPKSTRTFSLHLVTDEEDEELPTPHIDFNAKFKMTTTELQSAIKDSQIVGEYIQFSISPDSFVMNTTGDSGDVTIEITDLLEPEIKDEQIAIYALEFLTNIIKAGSVSEQVHIEFSTEMPIQLEFPLIDPENKGASGKLIYFLAPRVEEEDEDMDEISSDESDFEEEFVDDEM